MIRGGGGASRLGGLGLERFRRMIGGMRSGSYDSKSDEAIRDVDPGFGDEMEIGANDEEEAKVDVSELNQNVGKIY
jgi:hypothetical protein